MTSSVSRFHHNPQTRAKKTKKDGIQKCRREAQKNALLLNLSKSPQINSLLSGTQFPHTQFPRL